MTANAIEKTAAGDEGLKVVTVECLRGRLLAERTVSRNATQEADQIQNKVAELEEKLREEIKSRNRVEKRLKCLMKKLNSMNLSYDFDEEGGGDRISSVSLVENSEIFSVSSSSSSSVISSNTKRTSDFTANFSDSTNSEVAVSIINSHSSINASQNPTFQIHAAQSVELDSSRCNGLTSTSKEEEVEEGVDNSLALVVVENTKKQQNTSIDPAILDSNVKQVLDALRHAKEQLQTSMETTRPAGRVINSV